MAEENFYPAVSSGHALESLRDSDFDLNSALCEAIDNSIQAMATEVWINFDFARETLKSCIGTKVVFRDNGSGMNPENLHKSLSLGFSTRFNDRDGIGRFGVGMTLAAISQCKLITAISRQNQASKILATYLDIDRLSSGESKGLPEPSEELVPKDMNKSILGSNGTIVVWDKCDRILIDDPKEKFLKKLNHYLGRVYRKWLMTESVDESHLRPVRIFLNDVPVKFHDPLFSIKSDRFPADAIAGKDTITTMKFMYPIPRELIDAGRTNGKTESEIKIVMSLLPQSFRLVRFKGGTEFDERHIDDNEGVSILRAGREVHYDHIKYYSPAFKDIDRWWGCEISFDPLLDKHFCVKNIKVGVRIVNELKDIIRGKIEPTRATFATKVKQVWDAADPTTSCDGEDNVHGRAISVASGVASKNSTFKPKHIDKTAKQLDEEQKAIIDALAKDQTEQQKSRKLETYRANPYNIEEASWPGERFFDIKPLGDSIVLILNTSHDFYSCVYGELDKKIRESGNNSEYQKLLNAIDVLLISYSRAAELVRRSELNADNSPGVASIEILSDTLQSEWGKFLKACIPDLEKLHKNNKE